MLYPSTNIFNFNAGPAMLPKEVMEQAKEEFLNYKSSGMSVMEISHRSEDFQEILDRAEIDLRYLLDIPDDYSVIFCSAGATLQFTAVPLNLLDSQDIASYSLTGVWSIKAYNEAKRFCQNVEIVYDGEKDSYLSIPNLDGFSSPNSKFLYITSNNTIYGTQYKNFPTTSLPLVADMTSDILSRRLEIRKFGAIFAGAQKNIGPSGLTLLIVRKSLLQPRNSPIPLLLDWKLLSENKSLYNTPPTYSIYISGLVFSWLRGRGGLEEMEKINKQKSDTLYHFLDNSNLFKAPVPKDYRSTMNVIFHIQDSKLSDQFSRESEANGFFGLPGHRSAGGFRASIYNAMPIEGVEALVSFLSEFERKNG